MILKKVQPKKLKLIKQNLLKIKINNLRFKKISSKELDFIIMSAAFIKMTPKEQNKILDDKIKANKRQYDLDRTNAEILAYSSGDLPKYEYLTKKDLGYKPDAFEQAKFEYSPLGKVFTNGLDKSDRNKGLLRRLKDIEDKSNNRLLALENIYRPAIKSKDNYGYKSSDDVNDDDDDDKLSKKIEGTREEYEKKVIYLDMLKKNLIKLNKIIKY